MIFSLAEKARLRGLSLFYGTHQMRVCDARSSRRQQIMLDSVDGVSDITQ
jgi:hypothetical protein